MSKNIDSLLVAQRWRRSAYSLFHMAARAIVIGGGAWAVLNFGLPINIGPLAIEEAISIFAGAFAFFFFPETIYKYTATFGNRVSKFVTNSSIRDSSNKGSKSVRSIRADNSSTSEEIVSEYPEHKDFFAAIEKLWSKAEVNGNSLVIKVIEPNTINSLFKSLSRSLTGGKVDLDINTMDYGQTTNQLIIPKELFKHLTKEEMIAYTATRIANLQYDHDTVAYGKIADTLKLSSNVVLGAIAMLGIGFIFTGVASIGSFVGALVGSAETGAEFLVLLAKGYILGGTIKAANNGILGQVERQEEIINDTRAVQMGIDPMVLLSAHRKLALLRSGRDPSHENGDIVSSERWHIQKALDEFGNKRPLLGFRELFYALSSGLTQLSIWANPRPSYAMRRQNLEALANA